MSPFTLGKSSRFATLLVWFVACFVVVSIALDVLARNGLIGALTKDALELFCMSVLVFLSLFLTWQLPKSRATQFSLYLLLACVLLLYILGFTNEVRGLDHVPIFGKDGLLHRTIRDALGSVAICAVFATVYFLVLSLEKSFTQLRVDADRMAKEIEDRKRVEVALKDSNQHLEQTLAKLKETQEQVIQQERLLALEQMAGSIAHELNNTLSPVLAYTESMLLDAKLPTKRLQQLKIVQTAAQDTAAVVASLRTFCVPDIKDAAYNNVRLDGLLTQIVELTRPKWKDEAQRTGRSIEVVLELEDEITVLGNSVELREVFTNLVFNSVDAIPADGRITLSLHHVDGSAVVEVADTGSGMSEDVAARCCEPFFTTKATEGTGLGLSVCHGIIQRHGGHIEIDTQPDHGTTFRIFLPLSLQADVAKPYQDEKGSLPTRKVLYIDDDAAVRDSMSMLLKMLGQQVDVADGGAAGIEMFRSNNYDLVITDLSMPRTDGYQVTRSIKSIRGSVPVIIVTGWGTSDKLLQIDPSVAPDLVLAKPLTIAKLQSTLKNVFAQLESARSL